jgi:hypothetical protein
MGGGRTGQASPHPSPLRGEGAEGEARLVSHISADLPLDHLVPGGWL